MILVAAIVFAERRGPRGTAVRPDSSIRLPLEPLSLTELPTKGSPEASIGLIVYSDFECPFCRRFAMNTLPLIDRDLVQTGVVLLAFSHLPIEAIHRHAFSAAVLAECSHRNGSFWRAHDELFSVSALSKDALATVTTGMGFQLDSGCLSTEGPEAVRRQIRDAEMMGVTATPTLIVGRLEPDGRLRAVRALTGLQSTEAITSVVRMLRPSTQ